MTKPSRRLAEWAKIWNPSQYIESLLRNVRKVAPKDLTAADPLLHCFDQPIDKVPFTMAGAFFNYQFWLPKLEKNVQDFEQICY
jgi:hypothetical protein